MRPLSIALGIVAALLATAACSSGGGDSPAQASSGAPATPTVTPVAVTGPVPTAPAAPAPLLAGYRFVQGEGYVLQVPSDWQRMTVPGPAAMILRASTPIDGTFHVNLNVVSEPFQGDGPGYARASLPQIQAAATFRDQRVVQVGGLPGMDIEAQWPNQSPPTRTVQRFAAQRGQGYVFTCAGPITAWEAARAQCALILDTIRLTP
jgi:hypothetical protein